MGREKELSVLQAFCRGVDSAGRSLLLTGEPGAGKTALLDVVADWAIVEGLRVLRAQAARAELDCEYSTLNQLLLPLQDGLARLDADDQQTLSQALGFVESSSRDTEGTAAAASALLGQAAVDRPLLLVVDDLRWIDPSSAQVLGLLRHRLDGTRIRLLGASRSRDTGFFDSTDLPGTRVRPLDPTASRELVARTFPELDPAERTGLLARAGGNPLALLELPRVGGSGSQDQLRGPVARQELSRRVQHVFAADLQTLPAPTRRLLLLLALEGTDDPAVWGGSAGLAELRPAEQAGLIRLTGPPEHLTFTHPLVPLTVIALATSDDRRTAHRELAQRLAAWPGRRAPHLAEASTGPDEDVAAELEAAASLMARAGDAPAAVDLYRRSAALSKNPTNQARRFVHAAHLSITDTGDLNTGDRLLQEARRSDPGIVGSLRYATAFAALALYGRGDADMAHRALVEALGARRSDHHDDSEALTEAVQGLVEVCRWTQQSDHWRSLRAVLTELGNVVDEASPTMLVRTADCALPAGRLSPDRERLEAMVADGRGRGGTGVAIAAVCCLAQDAFAAGDWDRAGCLADEGLVWCHRRGDQLRAWTLRWVKALVAAGRGDGLTVDQLTGEMRQWADRHGVARVHAYAHHARALAALGAGQFEQAFQEAAAAGDAESPEPGSLQPALCLLEAAMHTRRPAGAAGSADLLGTYGDMATPRVALLVAAAMAVAAPEADRAQLFERALAQPGSAHYPFDLARVHLAYGQQLRRSRATSLARAHLRTALEIFERLDARPWVERTRIELGATGETRNQTETGLALTPQERTVALLAASGHSNKQIAEKLFLTHRTVAAHLHQVFPKLKVDSRAGLRDALDLPTRDPQHDSLVASR